MDILTDDFVRAGVRISASGRVSWPEGYQDYADRYGAQARTVRKWVADGKAAGELPPLFDPGAMVTWWKGQKRNKVPDGILAASQVMPKQISAFEDRPKVTGVTREDDDEESAETRLDDEHHQDEVDRALRDARNEVAITHRALRNARLALRNCEDGSSESFVESCRRDYNAASDNLRKWEKDFQGIQEKRKLLVRKSAIIEEIGMVATNLSRSYLNSMLRLGQVLAPKMSAKERRKLCVSYRDRCFDSLLESDFRDGLPDLSVVTASDWISQFVSAVEGDDWELCQELCGEIVHSVVYV